MMKKWLIAVMIVLALITEGPRQFVPVAVRCAMAAAPAGWYAVENGTGQCALQREGPAGLMALASMGLSPLVFPALARCS